MASSRAKRRADGVVVGDDRRKTARLTTAQSRGKPRDEAFDNLKDDVQNIATYPGGKSPIGEAARYAVQRDSRVGHETDSQQFLALIKYGTRQREEHAKTHTFLSAFKVDVQQQQRELHDKAKRASDDLQALDRRSRETFHQACAAITTGRLGEDMCLPASQPPQKNLLRAHCEDVLARAARMVRVFDETDAGLAKHKLQPVGQERLDAEVKQLKDDLQSGRQLGEEMVARMLGRRILPVDLSNPAAVKMYGHGSSDAAARTWAMDAKQQTKLIKKLVGTLVES